MIREQGTLCVGIYRLLEEDTENVYVQVNILPDTMNLHFHEKLTKIFQVKKGHICVQNCTFLKIFDAFDLYFV